MIVAGAAPGAGVDHTKLPRIRQGCAKNVHGRTSLGARLLVSLLLFTCGCAGGRTTGRDIPELCPASTSRAIVDASAHPIAFSSNRAGSADLWLMKLDGSDPVQLTSEPGDELMPSWSSDGRRLAFASSAQAGKSFSDICVIDVDGTGLQNLTRTDDASEHAPSWSPDGSRIVYTSENTAGSRIFVMDSGGGGHQELTNSGWWPDWSPDGERIVYTSTLGSKYEQLWVMDIGGTNNFQLTSDTSLGSFEPAWSPDGRSIAFVSSRDGLPNASNPVDWNEEIYVMTADGAQTRRVTMIAGNDHWPPAWSPDSQQLLFTADGAAQNPEIVAVDLSTLETTNLTTSGAHDLFPAWRGSADPRRTASS